MVFINKESSPASLENYKLTHPNNTYSNLKREPEIRNDIYNSLIVEQFGLCAYCMCRIFNRSKDDRNIQIEHFLPQSDNTPVSSSSLTLGEIKSLDYSNMLGVCDGGKKFNSENALKGIDNLTCDSHRKNYLLTINPLEKKYFFPRKIEYNGNGEIFSTDSVIDLDLKQTLNLNLLRLTILRKSVWKNIIEKISKGLINSKNKQQVIQNLKTPVNGELEPFYDVAVYFIEKFV